MSKVDPKGSLADSSVVEQMADQDLARRFDDVCHTARTRSKRQNTETASRVVESTGPAQRCILHSLQPVVTSALTNLVATSGKGCFPVAAVVSQTAISQQALPLARGDTLTAPSAFARASIFMRRCATTALFMQTRGLGALVGLGCSLSLSQLTALLG